MSNKITLKRSTILMAALALSILLIAATTTFAVTRLIKADKGGVVPLRSGAKLVIPPDALDKDTAIFGEMEQTDNLNIFIFGPSGTNLNVPVELHVTWQALSIKGKDKKDVSVEDVILYAINDEGDEIVADGNPEISSRGVVWHISHFSIYYHRRR